MSVELNLNNLSTEEQEYKKAVESAGIPTDEDGMRAEFEALVADSGLTITNTSPWSAFWKAITSLVIMPALWLVRALTELVSAAPDLSCHLVDVDGWLAKESHKSFHCQFLRHKSYRFPSMQ